MIRTTIGLIADQLNDFLGAKAPTRYRNAGTAVVSDLVNSSGEFVITLADQTPRDQILLTLVNVEEETIGKAQLPYRTRGDETVSRLNPEIKLNLFVLFSAFSNMKADERYLNSLELLSLAIRFFQFRPVFDSHNTPALPSEIEKIIVELVSLNFEQQNHLWGTLGAKYLPSVLYKLRMLVIRETPEEAEVSLIDTIRIDEVPRP